MTALPDDDGNTVPLWTKATVPKKLTFAVYLDAWRGGLRAWRAKRRGLLQTSHTGIYLHEPLAGGVKSTPLNMEEVISAMREDARRYGMDFEAGRTKRSLLQVARETNARLTAETFAVKNTRAGKPKRA